MVDRYLMDQGEAILQKLSIPVSLLEKLQEGQDQDEFGITVAPDWVDGQVVQKDGQLYLPMSQPSVVLCCQADYPGAKDLLIMASAWINALDAREAQIETVMDAYRRILRGEVTGAELEAVIKEHHLADDCRRCVLVFHITQSKEVRAYDLLRDTTPTQGKDIMIHVDRHTVAFIKDMTDVEGYDELAELAQAMQETLLGETAHQMIVGIGRTRNTLDELRESYTEARRAVEVGRVFHPDKSIYVFNRLILERFLADQSPETRAYYHGLLFNRKTARLFNEEMLYTIEMFFNKDLNLSDTSRQLYIHRNTLVYRLDKVQRQTGLDLRSFSDAVTFKILMELKKTTPDKTVVK